MKNQNAPRPSEHPPVRGKNVKAFRWDHRLQKQNLFMAFKRVLVLFGTIREHRVGFGGDSSRCASCEVAQESTEVNVSIITKC